MKPAEPIPNWRLARAARTANEAAEAQALIAEYESLKNTDQPRNLAIRLGYQNPTSLARRFHRYGRPDLAGGLWYPPN